MPNRKTDVVVNARAVRTNHWGRSTVCSRFSRICRVSRGALTTASLLLVGTTAAPRALPAQSRLVFNPQTNVANPDLIAYEALVGDRQQLTFHRLSDNKTFAALSAPLSPGALQAPGLAAGRGVTVFSGDMDWHPVRAEGSTGKQWFTYVATDRGVGKLFVNYLDAYGNLAKESPIQLPFAGGVRQPRWSPDGKHLAVVSDLSLIHI